MNQPPPGAAIRAILQSGSPTECADHAEVELFDTVGAALEAGVAQIRSATTIDGDPELRIAIDVGEVDLGTGQPTPACRRSGALLGASRSGQVLVSGAAAS